MLDEIDLKTGKYHEPLDASPGKAFEFVDAHTDIMEHKLYVLKSFIEVYSRDIHEYWIEDHDLSIHFANVSQLSPRGFP